MKTSLERTILHELRTRRSVVGNAPVWQFYDDAEWRRALAWLDLSGLALYFHDRLKTSGPFDADSPIPSNVMERLDRNRADNAARTVEMFDELRTLRRVFAVAEVPHIVLKGATLAPDYCADPALRTQYDHDFLVPSSALRRAEDALRDAGYRRKNPVGEHPVVYRRPEPAVRFAERSAALYSPLLGRSVELHTRLWDHSADRIAFDLPEDWFDRAVVRRYGDLEFAALCDEDGLIFQVLHALHHILGNWCRLSIFFEIARFLNRRFDDSRFWKRFLERAAPVRRLQAAAAVIFHLADRLFGAPLPPDVTADLRTPAALALWADRYGIVSALSNFRSDKFSLFLHREFLDANSDWTAVRRRRLFPIQRPHRLPGIVFQRGFSRLEKAWIDQAHALRRMKFHALAAARYALEYPRWAWLKRSAGRFTA